jgi:hypothetical protein
MDCDFLEILPSCRQGAYPPGLFPFAPLELEFAALGELRWPEYKGGLFRSGLGLFLREQACITGAPACGGCPHLARCAYPLVFENPIQPDEAAVLRRYTHAPHPFVLRPPLEPGTRLAAGAVFRAGLAVFGPAHGLLPALLEALDRMGRSGRYGGPFRLVCVRSALTGAELARSGGEGWLREPPLWSPGPARGPVRTVRLEFLTPLRIRTRGRYNPRPGFIAITHALLRRLHLLAAVHAGGPADSGWMRPLLEAADRIATRRAEWTLYRWSRPSGRQQADIPMDGLLGSLEAEGELDPLLPYLEAGQWLQVGSGTSAGLGAYRLAAVG